MSGIDFLRTWKSLYKASVLAYSGRVMNMQKHIPALDGIRGIAIIMVMVYHMMVAVPVSDLGLLIYKISKFGWCGVDLFFVLSGFLITGILIDSKGEGQWLRRFFYRRALRILPLYFGLLFFCLAVLPLFDHPKIDSFNRIGGDEWWYFLHLQNYSIALAGAFRHGILDVTWSLAIEEQFYLFWPIAVMFLSGKRLMALCVSLLCGASILRLILLSNDLVSPLAVYVLTPTRIDGLVVGAFLAVAVRHADVLRYLIRLRRYFLWVSGSVCFFCLLYSDPVNDPEATFSWSNQIIAYPLLALFFGSVMSYFVIGADSVPGKKLLESPWLITFGKYSYAMYLFHLPIRAIYRDWIFPVEKYGEMVGGVIPYLIIFIAISVLSTLIVAWFSWNLYEKHLLKLKDCQFAGKMHQ